MAKLVVRSAGRVGAHPSWYTCTQGVPHIGRSAIKNTCMIQIRRTSLGMGQKG